VIWRFGVFEFDPSAGELRKEGRLVRIEPQPARALALLLSRPGEVVSRDELRAHLWDAGTHVDYDRGIAYCMGQVRSALGDTADNPRFVQTLPRRGYRFVAPVQATAAAASGVLGPDRHGGQLPREHPPVAPAAPPYEPAATRARRWRWPIVALTCLILTAAVWTARIRVADPRPIVAVAVFDNETGRQEFDGLALTSADIMVERLTALGPDAVGVVGNTPALRRPRADRDPAAIERETGAGYLVFGQVQTDDVGVRMVVHLIRLDDDTHLWVTRLARAPGQLADIQDVVADRLAEAVRRHVIERDPGAPRFTP
jgi:DNA-binding winged helix-turn-helix (wHTH) protein/TolB-like protein